MYCRADDPKKAVEASHLIMAHFELTPEIEQLRSKLMSKPRVMMLAWNLSSETSTFNLDTALD